MGHVVGYLSEKENCNRKLVMSAIVERAERDGDGYDGGVKWHDEVKPLANRDEAEAFIRAKDNGWYDDHAVRYYDYSGAKVTKKIGELQTKARELAEKRAAYEKEHSVRTFKAALISCHKCGSKLAREYLKSDRCPLCYTDLRSDTTLETLKKYEERKKEVLEQIEKEKQKQTGEVRWLIKYEYHC